MIENENREWQTENWGGKMDIFALGIPVVLVLIILVVYGLYGISQYFKGGGG